MLDTMNFCAYAWSDQPLTSRKLVILLSRETIVRCVSVSIFFLSSSLYETYHLLNLVFPCLFCRRMNLICATEGRRIKSIRPHQSNHTLCICLPLSVSRVWVDRRLRAYSTESVVFVSGWDYFADYLFLLFSWALLLIIWSCTDLLSLQVFLSQLKFQRLAEKAPSISTDWLIISVSNHF